MWISKKKLEKMKLKEFEAGQANLKAENESLLASYSKAESDWMEAQRRLDELIQKLRTQSENDMIAEAVKLIFKGIKGEEKEVLHPHYMHMLAAQQSRNMYMAGGRYAPSSNPLSVFGGLFGIR